jgi:hypothetical protein
MFARRGGGFGSAIGSYYQQARSMHSIVSLHSIVKLFCWCHATQFSCKSQYSSPALQSLQGSSLNSTCAAYFRLLVFVPCYPYKTLGSARPTEVMMNPDMMKMASDMMSKMSPAQVHCTRSCLNTQVLLVRTILILIAACPRRSPPLPADCRHAKASCIHGPGADGRHAASGKLHDGQHESRPNAAADGHGSKHESRTIGSTNRDRANSCTHLHFSFAPLHSTAHIGLIYCLHF